MPRPQLGAGGGLAATDARSAASPPPQPLPLPLPRDGRPLGATGGAAWASPALAAHLAAQLAAAQASALRADGGAAPPPSAAGAASLFGGLPSGMNASALLAAAVSAGGASIAPPSLSQQPAAGADAAALLPLLYQQWLLAGGAAGGTGAPGAPGAAAPFPLAGAAFHRSALVPSSTLFRPVPVRATANATWRMVKSASMPELRELRLEDFADDSPRMLMPRPNAAGSAGGALGNGVHSDGGAVSDASARGRDGAMSPIAEGDSAGGATPPAQEAAVAV